jgi:hypothetical protein
MPIDPEPKPDGEYYFDARMRLAWGRPGSKPRMFKCHWDSCTKKGQAPRAEVDERERGCFRCGVSDHWVAECPEDE